MMLLAAALMLIGAVLLLLAARRQQPVVAAARGGRAQQGWSQQRLQEGLLRVGLPGSVPLFVMLILASLISVGLVLRSQGWPAACGLLLADAFWIGLLRIANRSRDPQAQVRAWRNASSPRSTISRQSSRRGTTSRSSTRKRTRASSETRPVTRCSL